MLLATFQPEDPFAKPVDAHATERAERYRPFAEMLGDEPIFCIPARSADEFALRCSLATPNKPEVCYIVDTDDFIRFDSLNWNNLIMGSDPSLSFDDVLVCEDERFSEYVIGKSNLKKPLVRENISEFMGMDAESFEDAHLADLLDAIDVYASRLFDGAILGDYRESPFAMQRCIYGKFCAFYASVFWQGLVGSGEIEWHTTAPFFPDYFDLQSLKDWDDFGQLLRSMNNLQRHIDHETYLKMLELFESAVASNRISLLNKAAGGRNNPCPCGSGKKLKQCCLKRPFAFYPWENVH